MSTLTCSITQLATEELCRELAGAKRPRGSLETDGTGTTFRGTLHHQWHKGLAQVPDHNLPAERIWGPRSKPEDWRSRSYHQIMPGTCVPTMKQTRRRSRAQSTVPSPRRQSGKLYHGTIGPPSFFAPRSSLVASIATSSWQPPCSGKARMPGKLRSMLPQRCVKSPLS